MDTDAPPQSLMAHLLELRTRLLRAVAAVLLCMVALLPFAKPLYAVLAQPLIEQLPAGASMIATGVAAPFMAPFKFVMMLAVYLAMPVVLHQLWAFVAPGLYRREKALALPLLVSAMVLFYLGMAFAYFAVFPVIFGFFASAAPAGVLVMTDVSSYLDFVLTLFLAFGVAFEVPVVVVLLVVGGFVDVATLQRARPYLIVVAFVIGMVLTPPDIFSQAILALPMCLLFEVGLLVARALVRRRATQPATP
ncbi:MAG TPA: twin-arginine translocase subunit TatC [Gammaproteobacteria bacterium]|jgi:sec-independent protein translocase protein TatC|uniref:twin-arginine translocase subunit TatC n=1 Tax=Immundisolibacter sp. TaxID=1934948 RepID=UPI000E7EE20A|nr:twin-arginine translocase subunit TatC [Gammaproteobacteria bacterium]MCH77221.1 twin-arginine translocase subunit TatC [Gammaproteobacteria bacterium]